MALLWHFLLVAMAQNPVVMVREPYSPTEWDQAIHLNCKKSALSISSYGPSVFRGGKPRIARDGRDLIGPKVKELFADLSNGRAVYRFSVQCGHEGSITLRIYEGEAQRDAPVRFRAGLATIKGNRLDFYTGLEVANAETFWWR